MFSFVVRGGMLHRGCLVYYGSDMLDNGSNMVHNRSVVNDRIVMVFLTMLLLMANIVANERLGGSCVSVTV